MENIQYIPILTKGRIAFPQVLLPEAMGLRNASCMMDDKSVHKYRSAAEYQRVLEYSPLGWHMPLIIMPRSESVSPKHRMNDSEYYTWSSCCLYRVRENLVL